MDIIDIAYRIAAGKKKKPAKKYALGKNHRLVNDDRNHYPTHDAAHARNALSRVMQHDSVPSWFDGTITQLRRIVINNVKKKFPSIEVHTKPKKTAKK